MKKSIFESIKGALNEQKGGSGFSDILRMEVGKTYEVKILPNVKEPKKTFFHYFIHGWDSFATGEYVSILSPATFNERDPISEERFKTLKHGSDEDKEKIKSVRRSEKWLVNVYVIKDPTNPENEGTVKIMRYGKQLQKIILDAIEGDDAEEFGEKVFDMQPGNAILKIKVEDQGGYASYTSSRFTTGTKFTMSQDEQKKVFEQIHDLETIHPAKSYDEVKDFFNTHFHLAETKTEKETSKSKNVELDQDDDDILNEITGKSGVDDDISDDIPDMESTGDSEIDELLAGIN
jgi:hypothetical protein